MEDATEPSEQATEEATAEVTEEQKTLSRNRRFWKSRNSEEELETDPDEEEEETEDTEEADEEEAEELTDDTLIDILVDGETTASIKDLKRLYGQEASLTRKSRSRCPAQSG